MKVILINPVSNITRSLDKIRKSMSLILPPIGIAYIAAVLEKNGVIVKVIDQMVEDVDTVGVLEIIKEGSPEIVGFSCLTSNMGVIREMIYKIRRLNAGIKIILGNVHASVFRKELLKEDWADFVIHGEGEFAFLEIVQALKDNKGFKDIRGISYKEKGVIFDNGPRDQIENLDLLPYPAWHLFKIEKYKSSPVLSSSGSILAVLSSRGCKYRCLFCTEGTIFKSVKKRNMLKVIDEIQFFYENFKVKTFGFADAIFPPSEEDGLIFSNEFIRRGLHKKITWYVESRVDMVNLELLKKMEEAGLKLIMYGFEVGNQKILNQFNKGTTLDDAIKAMEYTKKAGIVSIGLFILGLPGEDKDTCIETIRFAKRLNCDFATFQRAIPFPGSKFFEMYRARLIHEEDFDKFNHWKDPGVDEELIYVPKDMESKELIDLQKGAMLQFYIRPRLIVRHIAKRIIPFKILCYGAYILMVNYLKILIFKFKRKKYLLMR